jgi:hypothetical protein
LRVQDQPELHSNTLPQKQKKKLNNLYLIKLPQLLYLRNDKQETWEWEGKKEGFKRKQMKDKLKGNIAMRSNQSFMLTFILKTHLALIKRKNAKKSQLTSIKTCIKRTIKRKMKSFR